MLVSGDQVVRQDDFARHVKHVRGGSELYRADVAEGDVVLLLYQSGSGRTRTARILGGDCLGDWDEAEQSLGLPEGALEKAFLGR